MMQKYQANQTLIESILKAVKDGAIAIPEIQRHLVWVRIKGLDMKDSLNQSS